MARTTIAAMLLKELYLRVMKTIVVDINDRGSLQRQIAAQQPKAGDTLRFLPSNGDDIAVTVLLAVVSHMIDVRKERTAFAIQILNELFQDKSLQELEREIEQEYGVNIEIESKKEGREPNYQFFPDVEYAPRADAEYIKELQERAKESWVGKVDPDEWLNEVRGRA